MDALNRHSGISAGGEILANYSNWGPQLERIIKFYSNNISDKTISCGFKTKLGDIHDKDEFKKLLCSEQIKIIYLERKNVIKTVVSKFTAIRLNNSKGVWNITDINDRLNKESIDVDEFDKLLRRTLYYKEELDMFLQGLNLPVLRLCYEDLMLDESDVFSDVFNFLRVEYEDIKGIFIKHTNDDLKKYLNNFDDLKMYYKGTIFERMFDEVLIKIN